MTTGDVHATFVLPYPVTNVNVVALIDGTITTNTISGELLDVELPGEITADVVLAGALDVPALDGTVVPSALTGELTPTEVDGDLD